VNRWTGGFGLLLGIASLISNSYVGHCQDLKPKFHFESSGSVTFFDEAHAFETSPSFGVAGGFHFTDSFQMLLSFAVTPAHQNIQQAASSTRTDFTVYDYSIGLRAFSKSLAVGNIQPFVGFSLGEILIDPHTQKLDVGIGQSITVEPPSNRLFTMGFSGGLLIPLSDIFGLKLQAVRQRHKFQRGPHKWGGSTSISTTVAIRF